ncbi:MAG: hypothetical protein JO133_13610 [Burkholderiaceae bacterium]|nr:hypothetical protein [Burkholderiaceae bacterium]
MADPWLGRDFALRRVPLGEAAELLRESLAPYRAAFWRLLGLFVLLWIVVLALLFVQTIGPFLSEAAGAVAFTGYTAALDAASRSEPPDFRHLAVVARLGGDKLIVLMLTGVLPILLGILVLDAKWGLADTARFIGELSSAQVQPPTVMVSDLQNAANLASMPFTFVAPVWALYRWSASRSMAANLLACARNWRWVAVMTAFAMLADNLLIWMRTQGDGLAALSDAGGIATQMLLLAWTLALARRAFPPS